jgi:hypothetical protein
MTCAAADTEVVVKDIVYQTEPGQEEQEREPECEEDQIVPRDLRS